jgi:hydroxyacyl-ACP dehydratase HTD2-like protein with hotdog domain
MATYAFPVKSGRIRGHFETGLTRNLNGGNEYEFLKPIQAGDTITMTSKIADIFEREGRLGKMLFTIRESTYKNQFGEIVAKSRITGISY